MNILEIAVLGFAVWRVTSLLSQEEGPLGMFVKLRELFGVTHYQDGSVCEVPNFLLLLIYPILDFDLYIRGHLPEFTNLQRQYCIMQ